MPSHSGLNPSQASRILTGFKYVDQLLLEIESILVAPLSRSPFPKYRNDLSPAQVKVVQDYITRIRAQMVQALKSLGITPPEAQFGSTHSIRVNLEFADVTFEDCRAEALRGYGEVAAAVIPDLNGVVNEMSSLVRKASAYLAQGLGQDLKGRIDRLTRTSNEVELLKVLEQVISRHGLIEFRSALATVLEKLESDSFQIAVFGRVSSGKSSLLNYVLGSEVLPVGVNPITAIPTRIGYGLAPRVRIAFLSGKTEEAEIARLREFVSEESNPGNSKRVTRITVELPSERLREGVVFVDTPGLGSLATAGAAETLAYLPQCDLGVVLVDASSTLTQEDISTVQRLYEAAIPALVLLSKADLLVEEDRERSLRYIGVQMEAQLGLKTAVHPVSTKDGHARLLEGWFSQEIQPLYAKHQELARQSHRRKIGALCESVQAALKVQLELSEEGPGSDKQGLRTAEGILRRGAGRFEEARAHCLKASDAINGWGELAIGRAAAALAGAWANKDKEALDPDELVKHSLAETAADGASKIYEKLKELALGLASDLTGAARALEVKDLPNEAELKSAVKEMPPFDAGPLEFSLRRPFLAVLGRRIAESRTSSEIRAQAGLGVQEAFRRYGRMLELWARRTTADLQRLFDSHADAYRAQLERLSNAQEIGADQAESIRRDLTALSTLRRHEHEPTDSPKVG